MNKFFFVFLIIALFVFEVKTDSIPPPYLKTKIERLIEYLQENGLWVQLLRLVDYSEEYAIKWCMNFETYEVCEALVDDYLDDYDDDDDDDD